MHFNIIFERSKLISELLGGPISLLRFKYNHPIQNCQDYYRITGCNSLLNSFLEDSKVRFSQDFRYSYLT